MDTHAARNKGNKLDILGIDIKLLCTGINMYKKYIGRICMLYTNVHSGTTNVHIMTSAATHICKPTNQNTSRNDAEYTVRRDAITAIFQECLNKNRTACAAKA